MKLVTFCLYLYVTKVTRHVRAPYTSFATSLGGVVIDKNKIVAAGFSLGGLTALWLWGIEADKELFQDTLIGLNPHER
jgi:hypothetical protein